MTPTIEQLVRFSVPPQELYELYMDSATHSQATGAKARISRQAGGKFTAFDGALSGRNLLLVPDWLIVQAWKSAAWKKGDPDSILILEFKAAPGGSEVHLVHVNVPPQDHCGVTLGWPKFYWEPWKAWLAARQAARKARSTSKSKSRSKSKSKSSR